ncbi:43439_t:CDS:2, partial [Gigaspora margarita]
DEHEGGIESNEMLLDNKAPLEIFKENKDKIPYCKSYESMTRIYNDIQKEKRKEKGHRFWRPLTFYLYGPSGSEKSGLVQALFSHQKEFLNSLQNNIIESIQENEEIVSNHEQFIIETSSSENNISNDIIEISEDFISKNSENSLENEKETNCK